MIRITKNWNDFKSEIYNRHVCPQWIFKEKGVNQNNEYHIYAKDDYLLFESLIEDDGGADYIDFTDNYKSDWNSQLDYRDGNGLTRTHTSPRKEGTTTYFSGAGDSVSQAGKGERIIFNMLSTDISKTKTITYKDLVYIKDGIITCVGAPIGSYLDITMHHPTYGEVGAFGKTFNLLDDNVFYLNTDDSDDLPIGIEMKITIYNSVSLDDDNEPPKDFKVIGNVEMYRASTV